MKKILLLGGSTQQIVAIKTAKKLGYTTVLCDYLTDNPGQEYADKFYLVSTIDKEAVLEVARQEKVDGVLAYASDPAAPTAAYVAEKMNLPANPYNSVEILCNKDLFRKFLKENGFCAPRAKGYENIQNAYEDLKANKFHFPVIVKPVDSSGSKGITVLRDEESWTQGLENAWSYSRCHRIIIEEYIEKNHSYIIGGDIFVLDGKVVLWGLMNCHRDNRVNPLVPVGKSYPLVLNDTDLKRVKIVLERLVRKLDIKSGAMNVELVVDKSGNVFLLDVGPRSGGNMIPDLLGDILGVNVPEMSVQAAMGEKVEFKCKKTENCYATHNLHSNQDGIYESIGFDKELEKYIYRKSLYKKAGDFVEYFDNATKCLGIVFMKFNDEEEMKMILNDIHNFISIKLTSGGGNSSR